MPIMAIIPTDSRTGGRSTHTEGGPFGGHLAHDRGEQVAFPAGRVRRPGVARSSTAFKEKMSLVLVSDVRGEGSAGSYGPGRIR
jgi:hypothetical protein